MLSDGPGATRGADSLEGVDAALDALEAHGVQRRIWARDHTLWSPHPREVSDRMGWLDLADGMRPRLEEFRSFAREALEGGVEGVVLLGMGGSSLGPLVLGEALGSRPGYPRLTVLDSTVPSCVRAVTESIQPERTLFLVSSKSGATVETVCLYRHFRALVEGAVGAGDAGEHFAAITDAGTPLEALGREHGFRRVFLNPEDVGGRYSVLSCVGLVPAALLGLDLEALLERADGVRRLCGPGVGARESPGAVLGAAVAAMAAAGRDKLTLATSPAIASFALWVEQLVAESTGKEGKGVVPVAGEPLAGPEAYGRDRLFVHVRLKYDANGPVDAAVARLGAAGHPVLRLDLGDRYDLAAEFFRWEFATAVASSILGVNPFDQPDVQGAKQRTDRLLARHRAAGGLPPLDPDGSLDTLLASQGSGGYLAVLAYARQSPPLDAAIAALRRGAMERWRLATTSGYGPRYLHSTGQLHKGGPGTGRFLIIAEDGGPDIPVPGEPYTFGTLARAQALGDLESLRALGRPVATGRIGPEGEIRIS